MKEKSLKIYKSLFYMNLESLKNLIQEESDLYLTFPIPKDVNYPDPSVKLSVFDILRMKIDIWALVNVSENFKIITEFSSDKIYRRALKCKEYLEKKFPNFQSGFKYEKYRDLMLDSHLNNNYIEEDTFKDYVNNGFHSIDLELVNASVLRDEALVTNLLKRGANPTIELSHLRYKSTIIEYLSITGSAEFMRYNDNLMFDFNQYKYIDIFQSLSELYIAASTCKMLLLIYLYKVSD